MENEKFERHYSSRGREGARGSNFNGERREGGFRHRRTNNDGTRRSETYRPEGRRSYEGGYQHESTGAREGGFSTSRPRFAQYRPANTRSFGNNSERTERREGYERNEQRTERNFYPRRNEGNRPEGRPFPPRRQHDSSVYTNKKRLEYREKEVSNEPIRLNKYLANAGICSRREADDFIQAGVITVNGEVVTTLGAKVNPTDIVRFHDQPIRREKKVYLLLNKPKDCVTTTDDPQERKTVLDIVKNACAERIYPVGRLDRNTTGVLLLTNDGDLAAKLTHPKFGKKKIYAATLDRDLTDEDYNIIMAGIQLDDEIIIPDALEFTKPNDRRHIGLEIHSGQNRVVRRIFEKVGYKVMQLDRVSFAGLTKKNLSRGKYRFLNPREIAILKMGSFE